MKQLTIVQTQNMLRAVAIAVQNKKETLDELDHYIGDGDHGTGMATGFAEIEKELTKTSYQSVKEIFKKCGMIMIQSMGGASGVIFGSLFLSLSKPLNDTSELDFSSFSKGVQSAVREIKKRGGASLGDKTMIDALEPAADALTRSAESGSGFTDGLEKAEKAAAEGVEKTKHYIAKFGRAKSLAKRSLGYQDSGATTVFYIFHAMHAFCRGEGVSE